MSEVLEALKRMYNRNHHYNNLDEKVQNDNDYDIIEKELKDYQELQLKYHELLKENNEMTLTIGCLQEKFAEFQKKFVILKIIVNKDVNVKLFKQQCLLCDYDFYLKYNQYTMFGMTNELLTKEEFESLQRGLA